MQVQVREEGDVIIMDLNGRLVLGEPQEALRRSFDEVIGGDWKKIVLNVSGLARLDSSGIGELVACMKTARAAEAKLVLLQVEDKVRRILHVSQVLPLFATYDDEASALAALGESSD